MKNKLKELFQKSKFPFIMSIISFIVGCIFALMSKWDPLKVRLFILLIGFLPFIIFLVITLLTSHFHKNTSINITLTIITTILTIVLFQYYIGCLVLCTLIEAENPITDIKNYKHLVNNTRLLKIFPKEIPNNVEEIYFIYSPGALQGGTEIALYYVDNSLDLNEFDEKHKKDAIWIGHKNEYQEKKGLLKSAFSNTPIEYKNEDDFIIYLTEGKCDHSGYCNHGDFLFIAVNEKTNEVIYKSEQW